MAKNIAKNKERTSRFLSKNKFMTTLTGVIVSALLVSGLIVFQSSKPQNRLNNSWNYVQNENKLSKPDNTASSEKQNSNDETLGFPAQDEKLKSLTVLLVGIDQRPEDPSIGNTDTLILAQVNAASGQVGFLSVPRDTQINIPNYGIGKINMVARVGGGLNSTVTVLEDLLQQPIDGYVAANFSAFKTVIDTMGGVDIDIEKNMYYKTGDKVDGVINLKKGPQHLNGRQALQYARFRQDSLADIGRTVRQQKLLKAAADEFLQFKTLSKLPALIPQIYNAVETNLPINKLWSLAGAAINISQKEIISQTLPGNFTTENGISYWKIDSMECRQVASQFFDKGKTFELFSTVVKRNDESTNSPTKTFNNASERKGTDTQTVVSNGVERGSSSDQVNNSNIESVTKQKKKEIKQNRNEQQQDPTKEIEDSIIFETETLP